MNLPAPDLRSNLGTWSVPASLLPSVAYQLTQHLPRESFDPDFAGQPLETTYFDTRKFHLRKARTSAARYLTLRIRRYPGDYYALSAKTEIAKYRKPLETEYAEMLLQGGIPAAFWSDLLPGDLVARLTALADTQTLWPVVGVCFRRYAVEDAVNRLTLDVDIQADTGKVYPTHVLEFKSTADAGSSPLAIPLRPIKLSKFLWATS